MRMRKLGRGQSVTFCIPKEIQTKILAGVFQSDNESVEEVSDILGWAISETCVELQRSMPLWAAQGRRFSHQKKLWDQFAGIGLESMSKSQAEEFLEPESQTVEERYQPHLRADENANDQANLSEDLILIRERCREFNGSDLNSTQLQEEQERELSPEIVQERQVQKPASAQPATHYVHPDLRLLVSTGKFIIGSEAYKSAFGTLDDTSAAVHFKVSEFPCELFVTSDFARTVKASGAHYISDSYQRPVQWLITSTGSGISSNNTVKHMIIISQYEAQELLPDIMNSPTATLHLYAPRTNLGYRALDRLNLYNVPKRPNLVLPRELILQLNLFAGQLYVRSGKEYNEMCEFLGLKWRAVDDDCVVAADGFIVEGLDGQTGSRSRFKSSPVKFLKVFMTKIRRDCEGIEKTHMGKILDARPPDESDFEDPEGGV